VRARAHLRAFICRPLFASRYLQAAICVTDSCSSRRASCRWTSPRETQAAELTVASPRPARRSAPVEPRRSDRDAQTASPPANGCCRAASTTGIFTRLGSAANECAKSDRPTGPQLQVDVTHQISFDWREAIFSCGLHAESGEINDGDRVRALPPSPDRKTRHDVVVLHDAKDENLLIALPNRRNGRKSTRWHEMGLPDVIQSIDRS
jgi:hypothetical protein